MFVLQKSKHSKFENIVCILFVSLMTLVQAKDLIFHDQENQGTIAVFESVV